ncbi:MAG: type IV toxin-antitoxin system AbiEi family antitoxin domain-containing protein [Bacilli bacterium]|nr:type IV toxin-antitoxin system AbiEi family antitoxin domain-containing protein [Bacilli bacterium]
MKDNTNYSKLDRIFKTNGGYITREDIDNANIPSWFLSDFVKKNNLNKIAPGFYANDNFIVDDYLILQRRYPKYIYAGLSALYLLGLTDKIPTNIEVSAPQNYHPSRSKVDSLIIHKLSNSNIYELGIKEVKTMFGNIVKTYDEERTICDVIKYRDKYDSETFNKAIKFYIRTINNQSKLFKYARELGVEKKVYEIMEVVANAD